MKLKSLLMLLILLIASISGCAQIKDQLGRIEQGVAKNQEKVDNLDGKLADLKDSVNSVNRRVGELEQRVGENQTANELRFDEIDKKIVELNKQLEKFQKELASGNNGKQEAAEKVLNETIEECKDNCQMTLTVKKHKSINIRSGPSTEEKIVGVLKGGDKVTIVKFNGSWGKIKDTNNWCTTIHHWSQLQVEPIK